MTNKLKTNPHVYAQRYKETRYSETKGSNNIASFDKTYFCLTEEGEIGRAHV